MKICLDMKIKTKQFFHNSSDVGALPRLIALQRIAKHLFSISGSRIAKSFFLHPSYESPTLVVLFSLAVSADAALGGGDVCPTARVSSADMMGNKFV